MRGIWLSFLCPLFVNKRMLLGGGLFVCVGLRVLFYDFNKNKIICFYMDKTLWINERSVWVSARHLIVPQWYCWKQFILVVQVIYVYLYICLQIPLFVKMSKNKKQTKFFNRFRLNRISSLVTYSCFLQEEFWGYQMGNHNFILKSV